MAIFLGGAIGALIRSGLEHGFPIGPDQWPWPTFLVNMFGAFLLGCFLEMLREREDRSPHWHPFLAAGICGALSTFSTMMLELLHMIDESHWSLALGYSFASLALGLVAIWGGTRLTAWARYPL